MDEPPAFRSSDFLLSVLGLAASRDLFRDTDEVMQRTAEMRHVSSTPTSSPTTSTSTSTSTTSSPATRPGRETYDARDQSGAPARGVDHRPDPRRRAARPCARRRVRNRAARWRASLRWDMPPRGIDLTPAMVERARARCPEAELVVGGWDDLPYEDASFDLVTSSLALCHATDVEPPVREMARVVRPGGWLVISDIHPTSTMLGGAAGFPRRAHGPLSVRPEPHASRCPTTSPHSSAPDSRSAASTRRASGRSSCRSSRATSCSPTRRSARSQECR